MNTYSTGYPIIWIKQRGLLDFPYREKEVNIDCTDCYACCYQKVFVRDTEILEIVKYGYVPEQENGKYYMPREGDKCKALGKNGCNIYRYRPRACRLFDCRPQVWSGKVNEDLKAFMDRWVIPVDNPLNNLIVGMIAAFRKTSSLEEVMLNVSSYLRDLRKKGILK